MATSMAKWGSKKWVVNAKKILALQDLAFSYSQAADNNSSTEKKKTTNERGIDLFPLTFKTVLHASAGVDIRSEISSWKALLTKVNYFYLNGKKLFPKQLQLRNVSVGEVKTDNLGRMLMATLSFEFKEYDASTSSVKVTTTATSVKADKTTKKEKKTTNKKVAKATKNTAKVGSSVKITGKKYSSGKTVSTKDKNKSHKITKISGNLAQLDGSDWVSLDEISMT